MKSKQDLYELIKAMSKSEKRYFTLDAQKSGKKDSKYFELFKAINGMDEYDEVRLKKKFPKNLSADKAYLYDAILRSMRDYRSSKSISAQIKEMLLDATYLYERGLFSQSEDRLNEAKELAKSIDDQIALLEINKEHRVLAWLNRKDFENQFQELVAEKNANIDSLVNYFNYYDISTELALGNDKSHYSDKEGFKKIFDQKIDFDFAPKFPKEKQKYFLALALYHQTINEIEVASTYFKAIVDIWDENIAYRNEEPYRYVHDVSNLLSIYARLGKLKKLPELIQKLEDTSYAHTHIKGATFYIIHINKLMYFINTGEEHDILTLVKDIESGLIAHKMNNVRQIILMFNLTILLFMNGLFELSYEWSKKVIKLVKVGNQIAAMWPSCFLRLLSAYEFMDLDDFDNEIRYLDRLISMELNKEKESGVEALFQGVKNVINAPLLETNAQLKKLQYFIESSFKEDNKRILSQGIDELILMWIRSKLARKPIREVSADIKEGDLAA